MLALSLNASEGEELSRSEEDWFRSGNGLGERRSSSGRGDKSDKSYSLGFFRIVLDWLCNGSIDELSPRRDSRGRKDDFVVMMQASNYGFPFLWGGSVKAREGLGRRRLKAHIIDGATPVH